MSATTPLPIDAQPDREGDSVHALRGLAELAFGSLTRVDDASQAPHLALLHAESLELDLADPAQREFGDYELLEQIGEGGMGVVYRARQKSLDREVAVKLLSAGPWASRDFIARFEREAQNAARMQHPNIVTVFEAGSHDGLHFIAMRLVEGESLSALLKRGKRHAPREAAVLMRTVAEALAYAHSLGILHLDLKPGNVLVGADGTAYVADFGLARRLDSALAADNDEVSGTPAYMAPEQARVRSQKLTAATDVWGLGAILYELLTGQPPFRADSAQATIKLVLESSVRAPRRFQSSLPLDLQAIVLKCLLRDPDERYPSARALADDLARFIDGRPVQARPLGAPQRAWRWARREPRLAATAVLAFALLVIGLVATTQQWRRADANAMAARESLWATRAQAANHAFADGDGFRGLRPLVANLGEMEQAHRGTDVAIERQRIGTILANAPQLAGLVRVPPGQTISSVAMAPDGQHFAVATFDSSYGPDRFVRQYELGSLRETWSTAIRDKTFLMAYGDAGAPPGGLHYSADGRFLLVSLIEQPVVPVPRYSDMIAVDARDGRVLDPIGIAEPHADIVYDDALKHALVRFRSDRSLRWPDSAQFHAVAGWKPVGPRHTLATTLAADLWLPAPGGDEWLGTRDGVNLALYRVPTLAQRWQLALPATSIVRSWRFSHDGRWLALGSVDGTVRLVAVHDGHAVALAAGPAARVLRVEFSADDGTVAAVDANGQLWSWDVATGVSRAAPLQLAANDGVADIRFAGDTIFGGGYSDSGDSRVAYATLAPKAPFDNQAVPGTARVHGASEFGTAFDVSVPAHRLVTAAQDGVAAVWALPAAPLLPVRAAPLQPLVQTFDGSRVVVVDDATARVVDVVSGAPRSPLLRHPEPVRFAELAPDGRSLVTIAGRSVRVVDTKSWHLLGAPVVLPEAPQRVAFAADAPVLVVTTGAYVGGERHETVHRIDLAHGARLGQPVLVDALQEFRIDAQGRYAQVTTWSRTRATEFKRVSLADGSVGCAPKFDSVWSAVMAPNGRDAWYVAARRDGIRMLRHWDLAACRERSAGAIQFQPGNAVLEARGDELIVHRGGNEAMMRFGADARRLTAVGDAIPGAMYEFALSVDGARAAIATRNAVHLVDAHGGRRLSAPLTAPIAGDDAIARLAFSPDGARLLARTINHRLLFWQLPPTAFGVADLSRLTRMLDPDPAAPPADADLAVLGAQLRSASATLPAEAAIVPEVDFAPAAGAGVDPRFAPLDLATAINVPLAGRTWSQPAERGDQPTLARGVHRFLGIDYRVDGGVQLSGGGSAVALHPEQRRSGVVPVANVRARRVHVLAFMHLPVARGTPPRAFGYVVLIGADGRETRLEIRTMRDVITDHASPKSLSAEARVAFFGLESAAVRWGRDPASPASATFAVSLDVPPGTGPIRGLRFDVADGPMEAPLFYAATLERAPDATAIARHP